MHKMINSFENIAVNLFPELQEEEFIPIEKKYLKVILWNIAIFFSVALCIVLIVDFTDIIQFEELFFWIYFFIIIVFGSIFASYILSFKTRLYLVRDKDISYKSGLFFKKTTTVPFNRIQHLEIDQGPFSKLLQLASLSVFTAGDSSDDLEVNGISLINAEKIKEFITNKIDG